jgi:hypothetical protein
MLEAQEAQKTKQILEENQMKRLRSVSGRFSGFQRLLLVTLVISFSACATGFRQQVNHAVIIKNIGKENIVDVYVDYGYPIRFENELIRPGGQTNSGGENLIPERMSVSWTSKALKRPTVNLDLRRYLEFSTRLRAVELWINEEELEVYQATPRGAQEEFTDRKRIHPR